MLVTSITRGEITLPGYDDFLALQERAAASLAQLPEHLGELTSHAEYPVTRSDAMIGLRTRAQASAGRE